MWQNCAHNIFKIVMKKLFITLLYITILATNNAIADSISGHQLAGNLYAYPYLETLPPSQTPPPEGYKPFHLEHYGRHGSRWLIGQDDYLLPVRNLEKAEKADKLTELGKTTLDALRKIQQQSVGRLGELTDIGARQHYEIGRRMARNFPEIFTPEADLTAKSTVVIRCILSMANSIEGIESVAEGVRFHKDASEADMWFMNFDDKPSWIIKDSVSAMLLPPYRDSLISEPIYLSRLVTDSVFATDSVAPGLLPRLYWVLGNAQSHSGQPWLFEEVFSRKELEDNWKAGNAGWFIHGGHTPLTEGRMPFVQRNLLKRIIERTDSAMLSSKPSANLRYGHDGILVSIITLMNLGGYGNRINTLQELENSSWRDFDIFPMAGNMQLVFYRPENSLDPKDVLVKALVNEKEVSMPATPVSGPYYRWHDLRELYLNRLANYETWPQK